MKKKTKIALAALGAAAAANAVHAAVYRPKKVDIKPIPEEKVDVDRYRKNLSRAMLSIYAWMQMLRLMNISCSIVPTISNSAL